MFLRGFHYVTMTFYMSVVITSPNEHITVTSCEVLLSVILVTSQSEFASTFCGVLALQQTRTKCNKKRCDYCGN